MLAVIAAPSTGAEPRRPLTCSECLALGGRVIESHKPRSSSQKYFYGAVTGFKCSCSCYGGVPLDVAERVIPDEALRRIPKADKNIYEAVNSKDWKNPVITIRPFGIDLGLMQLVDPKDLASALAHIPLKDWPYGLVVGVQQPRIGPIADEAEARMEKNLNQCLKVLNKNNIAVRVWRSA